MPELSLLDVTVKRKGSCLKSWSAPLLKHILESGVDLHSNCRRKQLGNEYNYCLICFSKLYDPTSISQVWKKTNCGSKHVGCRTGLCGTTTAHSAKSLPQDSHQLSHGHPTAAVLPKIKHLIFPFGDFSIFVWTANQTLLNERECSNNVVMLWIPH